jgi:hypothetical protein
MHQKEVWRFVFSIARATGPSRCSVGFVIK